MLPDEWVGAFDDMVAVQQKTEAERDALRAENERLRAALGAVIAEADRKTAAFDRARELLVRHKANSI